MAIRNSRIGPRYSDMMFVPVTPGWVIKCRTGLPEEAEAISSVLATREIWYLDVSYGRFVLTNCQSSKSNAARSSSTSMLVVQRTRAGQGLFSRACWSLRAYRTDEEMVVCR